MTLLCTVLGMIGWAVVHFVSAFVFGHIGSKWTSGGVIGVGNGYSIELEIRGSSPVGFAEYDQRLRVYASGKDGRSGKHVGTVDLFPNTGGRTHSLVYSYRAEDGSQRVQIQERSVINDVDLTIPRSTNLRNGTLSGVEPAKERVFVGTYSGESYPLKFLPPSTLPEDDSIAMLNPSRKEGEHAGAGKPH